MKSLSQKISIVFLFLIVFSLISPLVSAANTPGNGIFGGGGSSSEDLTLGNPFGIIWEPIKAIFSGIDKMTEADAKIVMRALVFLVIFVVFFGVFKMLSSSSKGFEWLGGNIGMVLSFALAVMSCIFIPEQALTAIGGSYGQIAMLILFMPVLLVMILLIIKTENHWAKLALLLASTYMIAYFNMFFKASRYADNSIGGLIFRVLSAVIGVWMIIELFGGLGSLPFMGGGEGGGGGFKLPGRGSGDVPRARLDKQTENAQRGADAASKVAQNLGPEMRNRLQELDNSTKDLSGKMKAIAATLRDLAKIVPEVKGMLGKGSGSAFKQKFGAKYMALRQEFQGINDPITKISNDLMIIDRDLKEMARFAEQAVQELKKAGENQVTRDETNELKRMLEAVQRELQELAKVNTGFYNVRAYLQGAFNRNGNIMKGYMFAVKGEITTSISIFNEAANRFDTLANSTIQLERSARTIERNFAYMEQSANRIKERLQQNTQLMQPANI